MRLHYVSNDPPNERDMVHIRRPKTPKVGDEYTLCGIRAATFVDSLGIYKFRESFSGGPWLLDHLNVCPECERQREI